MSEMTSWERVEAAVRKGAVDRVPYALWRHFHREDSDPEALAEAEVRFFQTYQPDLLKLNPSGWYWVEELGVCLERDPRGYSAPQVVARPITEAIDWTRLKVPRETLNQVAERLLTIERVQAGIRSAAPLFETVFSPLTLAYKLAGSRLRDDLEHSRAQAAIARILQDFSEKIVGYFDELAARDVAGIFYAVQTASVQVLSRDQYLTFGLSLDKQILDQAKKRLRWVILHLHGESIFFDESISLPYDFLSWHMRETQPSLQEALPRMDRAILGGVARATLRTKTPENVRQEVRDALAVTHARGIVIALDCTIHPLAPHENLQELVRAAAELSGTL